MIKTAIEQHIRAGLPASANTDISRSDIMLRGQRGDEIFAMLARCNGLYAYDSALHIFPVDAKGEPGIRQWNSDTLWKYEFEGLCDGYFFFAEDIFGFQFGIKEDHIWSFNPESAKGERIASSLEEWAQLLLEDLDFQTGYPFAREWQKLNGPLQRGKRIAPRIPFVAGGEFALENLVAIDAIELMRFRGSLATQIQNLPDGATIKFKIVD